MQVLKLEPLAVYVDVQQSKQVERKKDSESRSRGKREQLTEEKKLADEEEQSDALFDEANPHLLDVTA